MSQEINQSKQLYYRKKYGNTKNMQWQITAEEIKTSKGNVGFFFEAILDIAANHIIERGTFDKGDIAKASYYTGIPNKKGFLIVDSFVIHNLIIENENCYELVNFAKYNPSFKNIQEYSEKNSEENGVKNKSSKDFHNDYNNLVAKANAGKVLNEKDVAKIPALLEYFKNFQDKFKNLQEFLRKSQEDLRQFKNDNIEDTKSQILESKKTKAKKVDECFEDEILNKKDSHNLELPVFLNKEVWQDWVAHRKAMKKPLTPQAIKIQLNNITRWHNEGFSVNEIINTTIGRNWQGLEYGYDEVKKRTTQSTLFDKDASPSPQLTPTELAQQKQQQEEFEQKQQQIKTNSKIYHTELVTHIPNDKKCWFGCNDFTITKTNDNYIISTKQPIYRKHFDEYVAKFLDDAGVCYQADWKKIDNVDDYTELKSKLQNSKDEIFLMPDFRKVINGNPEKCNEVKYNEIEINTPQKQVVGFA